MNWPFYTLATTRSNKRARAQAVDHHDTYGQPSSKKQFVELYNAGDENADLRRRSSVAVVLQDKPMEPLGKRLPQSRPTAFEKKLAAVREKKPLPQDKPEEPLGTRLARSDPAAFEKKLAAVCEKKPLPQDKPKEPLGNGLARSDPTAFGNRRARLQPTVFKKELAAVRKKKLLPQTQNECTHKQDNMESIPTMT
ncbi:unnamed protein product [Zymoseptoria tritici ST99CH_1A5]|uniref:Uncharacterized protein n=1 Tax=Zymoseptoria tritici ST99CH_1A5 TaxID=1276529 RepID=A0A1Y6M610_ZYMTR|nr:unnamed protein product [Zymoseptoria tritici ST99CH_1A5]